MSDQKLREAIEEELAEGPLWASELVSRLAKRTELCEGQTADSMKAGIWNLVENYAIQWEADGRLSARQQAEYAR